MDYPNPLGPGWPARVVHQPHVQTHMYRPTPSLALHGYVQHAFPAGGNANNYSRSWPTDASADENRDRLAAGALALRGNETRLDALNALDGVSGPGYF